MKRLWVKNPSIVLAVSKLSEGRCLFVFSGFGDWCVYKAKGSDMLGLADIETKIQCMVDLDIHDRRIEKQK